ncbi:MAG: PilZ domain-containing protein [Myxococcota bacterium]
MSEATDSPQRRSERVRANIPVRISTIEPDLDPLTGRTYFRASQERCANLSRGGVFVETHELLDPGRRVLVELSLPDGEQVEAIGRVAWTKRAMRSAASVGLDCGVGIEFLGGAAEQLRALEDFVTRGARGEIDH